MALGRRRFTRAIVVRPPLDFTAASGDATVAAETAAVALAAGITHWAIGCPSSHAWSCMRPTRTTAPPHAIAATTRDGGGDEK